LGRIKPEFVGVEVIQLSAQVRILVAVKAVDFRNGIDGLARICKEHLQSDPFSGCVYVFRNRRGTALKVLMYDGRGFWLCQRRLSSGRFRFWPAGCSEAGQTLEAHQLQLLLAGGNPASAQVGPMWRPLPQTG
jgi:transposase